MKFNLGIDVGDGRVVAAAERAGSVRVVTLGRSTREVQAAAFVEADGTVRVGEEALGRGAVDPEGLIPEVTEWLGDGADHRVNGWSVTGEVLLAHVLAAVVRQAAQQGDELGRVTLVHPSGWSSARVEALHSAATSAGIVDAQVASAERAVERAPANVRGDALRAAAVGGAALAAARGAAPAAPPTQMVPPVGADPVLGAHPVPAPDPVTGVIAATSVFGAEDLGFPQPASDAGAGAGAGSGGFDDLPPMAPPGGGGFEPPRRNPTPFYIAGGVLAVALIALIFLLVNNGGDGDDTTGSSTTEPGVTSSTSDAPSTSTTSTTSTTTSTTSTTVPETTTTSTTTTIPREVGPVGLLDSGLVLGYGTTSSQTLFFGDQVGDTMVALQGVLGRPDSDTDWKEDSLCGDLSRRVTWGNLEVVFIEIPDLSSPDRIRTFEQWFVGSPGTRPPGLVTLDRIGIGSTVADLKRAYPGLEISRPVQGDRSGFFTTQPEGSDLIAGITADTTDTATVRQLWAGAACQRIAE